LKFYLNRLVVISSLLIIVSLYLVHLTLQGNQQLNLIKNVNKTLRQCYQLKKLASVLISLLTNLLSKISILA